MSGIGIPPFDDDESEIVPPTFEQVAELVAGFASGHAVREVHGELPTDDVLELLSKHSATIIPLAQEFVRGVVAVIRGTVH